MKRAYNIKDVMKRNYPTLDFEGKWRDACGIPADRGTWVIYGKPNNGKTSLCMQLVKYLASNFGKVYYNSYEEGLSLIESIDGAEALWIYPDGSAEYTPGFGELIIKKY